MKKSNFRSIPLSFRALAIASRGVLTGSFAALAFGTSVRADIFDLNGTTAGFGVADNGSYDWWGTGLWAGTPNDTGTAATATWVNGSRQAFFIGAGTGTNYTVRLGSTGSTATTLQNIALNVNSAATGQLTGAAGNVTIGNAGDTGILTLAANNSVGTYGGVLTINNGINLATRTLNFRGGELVVNGLVSGSGVSKIAFGGTAFGYTTGPGTITLANTANTYAGRANSDYINSNFTLAVTKLADGGQNSSIGISTANIGINGGTLKYIGSTGAQSTNLGLHVGSSGAFVDASGVTSADTITISGSPTYSAVDSARTITLRGSNLGDNTMAFAFGNNGTGVNILTKTGSGRWIVNQANSYTGGTNAQNGTLVAANTAAFGAAGRSVNVGFNSSVGAVEFATDTTANAYVLNVSSGYTGTVVVNRATSGTDITHTMGTATFGNGTLNIQKGANVTGTGTLELAGITLSAGATGLATGTMLIPTTANVLISGPVTRTGTLANLLTLDGTSTGNLISGVISGSQALIKSNSSTWELSGANTFTGTTKVNGGTLKLSNNLALQSSVFDASGAGTLDVTTINTPTFGGLTSSTSLALPANVTSLTLNPASGTATYSGNLSGGAVGLTLTKSGAGTQILSGSSSHTGLTTVSAGNLTIGNNSGLGSTAGDTTVTGGSLRLANGVTVTGETLLISGTGSDFNGALQADAGAAAEWAGTVKINGGGARVGAGNGGTLTVSGAIVDNAGFTSLSVGAGVGGTGTVVLSAPSGTNTYTGITSISRGTLKLGANNTLPAGTVLDVDFSNAAENSIFDLAGFNQTVAGLQRTNTNGGAGGSFITNSGAADKTLTINQAITTTYSGVIQDGATNKTIIVKNGSGALTLSGNNSYSGGTSINAGTATAGHINAFGTETITLATGATLDLGGLAVSNNIINLGGTIIGAANYAPTVAQTLSGSTTYTGTVGGTLNVNTGGVIKGSPTFTGSVALNTGGTISPGASPGTVTGADMAFNDGGSYVWELNSVTANPGVSQDLIALTGTLTIGVSTTPFVIKVTSLDGSNNPNPVPDFNPFIAGTLLAPGYAWTIVSTSNPIVGFDESDFSLDFSGFQNTNQSSYWHVQLSSDTTDLQLVYVPEPSTYAALAGLAALGLAWKRRRNK